MITEIRWWERKKRTLAQYQIQSLFTINCDLYFPSNGMQREGVPEKCPLLQQFNCGLYHPRPPLWVPYQSCDHPNCTLIFIHSPVSSPPSPPSPPSPLLLLFCVPALRKEMMMMMMEGRKRRERKTTMQDEGKKQKG